MTNLNQTNPRREWLAVAAVTVLGAALRFWGFTRLGLEHFDEGIYALAGLWPFHPRGLAGLTPDVIAYAPPGFPVLVGMAYLVFGVADLSAIVVSIFAGVVTIPTAAWLGRRSFGPGAGVASAVFAAVSGPHVAFSRMALTDSLFLLVWLIALGLGMRFLERPRLGRALVFGLAVGLAQNVKYNGGLTGVIVALAGGLMMVKPEPGQRRDLARLLGYGLIAAAVSVLVYLPWYRFVEAHGTGYAGLMAHHRSYLGGVRQWLPHWRTQWAEQVALAGLLAASLNWGVVAWPLAWIGARRAVGGGSASRWDGMRFRLGLFGGATALGASASLPWWIALVRSPALLIQGRPAARVIAVGWIMMAVLTPFYHPYARLWLPLHGFGWLILAGLVVDLGGFQPAKGPSTAHDAALPPAPQWQRKAGRLAIALAVAASFGLDRATSPHPEPLANLLGPSDSFRLGCEWVAREVRTEAELTGRPVESLRVFARPPALFYLSIEGVPIERVDSLDSLFRPPGPKVWALHDSAVDPAAVRSDLATLPPNPLWNEPGVYWTTPNPPTLLDLDPATAFTPGVLNPSIHDPPYQRLTLFRPAPVWSPP